jgi:hypothetical protein
MLFVCLFILSAYSYINLRFFYFTASFAKLYKNSLREGFFFTLTFVALELLHQFSQVLELLHSC